MITVTVFFYFETKEEWNDFGSKFSVQSEFIKYSPYMKKLMEDKKPFCDLVDFYNERGELWLLGCLIHVTTKSEKVLRKVKDFIKENHYENNYLLRDNWGNKLRMDFDELFEWWSDVKSNRVNNK